MLRIKSIRNRSVKRWKRDNNITASGIIRPREAIGFLKKEKKTPINSDRIPFVFRLVIYRHDTHPGLVVFFTVYAKIYYNQRNSREDREQQKNIKHRTPPTTTRIPHSRLHRINNDDIDIILVRTNE